jgi:chromosome partitioning protein
MGPWNLITKEPSYYNIMGTTIGMINRKGGSMKSTTVSHCASALTTLDRSIVGLSVPARRVLVIDLDAQMHAGKHLGVPRNTFPGLGEVLFKGQPIHEAIRVTNAAGVEILPGSRSMCDFDLSVADIPGRERILADLIAPVRAEYDYILIDCPPGPGLIHVNTFLAADWLVIPCEPEASAMEGILELAEDLTAVKASTGAGAEILGILFARVDRRTREHRDNLVEARVRFGSLVMDTTIRSTTRIREACREHLLITQYAPRSEAGRDYEAAAAEIVTRVAAKKP